MTSLWPHDKSDLLKIEVAYKRTMFKGQTILWFVLNGPHYLFILLTDWENLILESKTAPQVTASS